MSTEGPTNTNGPTYNCMESKLQQGLQLYVFVSSDSFTSKPALLKVFLGLESLLGTNPNKVNRTAADVIAHPDYSSGTLNNDIALIKLSSPVTFNNFISPVCLAASESTFYSGVDSWVTGWGNIGFNSRWNNRTESLVKVGYSYRTNRFSGCSESNHVRNSRSTADWFL